MKIRTNSGEKDYDSEKVKKDFLKAYEASGNECSESILVDLEQQVRKYLNVLSTTKEVITKEDVLDIMEDVLMANKYYNVARSFIKYRFQHVIQKETISPSGIIKVVNKYIDKSDWKIKENANMAFSLQGLNNSIITEVTEKYWLDVIYPEQAAIAHKNGYIYIHDLGLLANYCCGWDLNELLLKGFGGVPGKISSGPAKHFSTALGQLVNFLYTLQGEIAGAVAVSNIDTLLSPFIAKDGLNYKEVKQIMQEFIYNMNVPTRVGFQCLSEDTEILTQDGWKDVNNIKITNIIATYNINTKNIEYLPIESIFKREYSGEMYHITGNGVDQLVSPKHRILIRSLENNQDILTEVEQVNLKENLNLVVGSNGMVGKDILSNSVIQLTAWIITKGDSDKRGCISINNLSEKNYSDLKNLFDAFKLSYKKIIKNNLISIQFDLKNSKRIGTIVQTENFFKTKYIPNWIYSLNAKQAGLFINTCLNIVNGKKQIQVNKKEIKDGLSAIAVLGGFFVSIIETGKDEWLLSILTNSTALGNIVKENYNGIIWCPTTKNNTVIARRNGKVFITGNSPFSNVTLDLKIPKHLEEQPIIIGGKYQNETYGRFQKEVDMFNKAFFEIMLEGDYDGRVFTFPIPTLNIGKDFDWDNPSKDIIWEATAKRGIPYFANFINSDMDPKDTRSMCCRLRIDNRELRKRGGGLFGANPLTGSIGVCTLNLPMLSFEANGSVDKFYTLISKYMDISKNALEAKRKVLETFTEKGLYPYSKVYLSSIKQRFDKYWANHFSTIGIIGMYEAAKMLGIDYMSEEGRKFGANVLLFMRERLLKYQNETGNLYNLEATPAEGASFKLALKAKEMYPKIFTSGVEQPYFTNSSALPVNYTDNLFQVLEHQNEIQPLYTGGSVTHIFLGERIAGSQVKLLIQKIFFRYKIPYISITPTFSICPKHGYLSGEHKKCIKCLSEKSMLEEKIKKLKEEIE